MPHIWQTVTLVLQENQEFVLRLQVPGATNLITGIATASADSSPIIAITGQVASDMIGKDAFQECDIIGIATPVTKYTYQPLTSAEVPQVIKKFVSYCDFRKARSGTY